MPGYICQDSLFWSYKICPITKFVNPIKLIYFQFFTYNPQAQICGLRNFVPATRAFSLGNLSGLKNEAYTSWTLQLNSVYVGRLETTETCGQCTTLCQMDPQCKSVIFNGGFQQCSFNYGTGPVQAISLPPVFNFFGIRSSLKTCNTI